MKPHKKVLFTTAYIRDRSDIYNWMQRSNVVYGRLKQPVIFDGHKME